MDNMHAPYTHALMNAHALTHIYICIIYILSMNVAYIYYIIQDVDQVITELKDPKHHQSIWTASDKRITSYKALLDRKNIFDH